jgi:glucosamine--fructose-6-phosphate aminotransferase (isomerizing)
MLGVINVVDSLLAREVHCGVYLNACREVSVASTKSFSSMCLVLSLIAIWLYQAKGYQSVNIIRNIENIHSLSHQIAITLEICSDILPRYLCKLDKRSMFILGGGKMLAIADEAALKIKEVSYIHAESYSLSSLKHGPFALLERGFPVILIIDRLNRKKGLNAYEEIRARYASILVVTELDDLEVDHKILVPANNDYQDIINIIVFQYIAYLLSIKKKINPDKPRNLAKVVTVN